MLLTDQYIDVSAKDLTTRYANDVIASCAFGLKVDSQSVDSHFYVKAKEIVNFDFTRLLKIFFLRCLPSIADVSHVHIIKLSFAKLYFKKFNRMNS